MPRDIARIMSNVTSASADACARARYVKKVELSSKEYLWSLFHYDPDTGILTYKKSSRNGKRKAGAQVTAQSKGYLKTYVDGREAYVHCIAWKMMTGDDVPLIDHHDRNRLNNKWSNLRERTHSQNLGNSGLSAHNKSGVRGVHWDKWKNKWASQITIGDRKVHLGRYHTIDEAKAAYNEAALLHFGSDYKQEL